MAQTWIGSKAAQLLALAAMAIALAGALAAPAQASEGGNNDPSCKPTPAHPQPIVFLHGLGATYYEDLNVLQAVPTVAQTIAAYLRGELRPMPQPPGGQTYTHPSQDQIARMTQRIGRSFCVDFIE